MVVPVGTPVKFTVTEPVNPFSPTIETWTAREPPGGTLAELGVAAMVKSGGGGGGPEPPPDELPLPQEAMASSKVTTKHARIRQLPGVFRRHRRTQGKTTAVSIEVPQIKKSCTHKREFYTAQIPAARGGMTPIVPTDEILEPFKITMQAGAQLSKHQIQGNGLAGYGRED